jgi:hypothetical protein
METADLAALGPLFPQPRRRLLYAVPIMSYELLVGTGEQDTRAKGGVLGSPARTKLLGCRHRITRSRFPSPAQ